MTTAGDSAATSNVPGACLCGAVTFSIAPPYRWFAHCHCSICRKHSGTLGSTGLGVAEPRLRRLTGDSAIVPYRASAAFDRPFCGNCGSKLPGRSHEPGVWHVPAGLLDGDVGVRPRSRIFVASKSSLHEIADGLPRYAGYPPGIDLPAIVARSRHSAAAASGSCLCGTVAFDLATAPRLLVHCHCSLCRRSRGTGFSSTLVARAGDFHWRSGRERVRRYAVPPPHTYTVHFCASCGSIVPTTAEDAPHALVPAGSIDSDLPLPTVVHAHVASKAPWDEIADAHPRHAGQPPPTLLSELLP
jgi:hypothetical protein